jgi:hypothetical protein
MKTTYHSFAVLAAVAIAGSALLSGNRRAAYGPPLLCFAYDIGSARSLPWGSNPNDSFECDPKYPADRLVGDTLAILDESKEVLVHMETLRRAAIYASRFAEKPTKGRDGSLADRMALRVLDHSIRELARDPQSTLAWIDAGYALGAAAQMGSAHGAAYVDHFSKARALAPKDPALAFATSAGFLDSPDRDTWQRHYTDALAGAPEGSLLRKNVLAYGERFLGKEKMAELLGGAKDAPTPKKTKG